MNKIFNKKIIFSAFILFCIFCVNGVDVVNAAPTLTTIAKTHTEEGLEKLKTTSPKVYSSILSANPDKLEEIRRKRKDAEAEQTAKEEAMDKQIIETSILKKRESSGFVPLWPIPGLIEKGNTDLTKFFNNLFNIGITIAGFLSVVMIAVGGIQYMSTDAVSNKTEGKDRITYALLGLLLVLFSWILLYTINPDILKFNLFEKNSINSSESILKTETEFSGGKGGTFSGGGYSGSC